MEANRTQVHRLPTKKAENSILKFHNGGGLAYYKDEYFTKSYLHTIMAKPYHLYFTSDEKLKNGDNCTDGTRLDMFLGTDEYLEELVEQGFKKIIATTDPELKEFKIMGPDGTGMSKSLPQPSKAFIEKYCKAGGIDEVLVEYELNIDGTNAIDRSHYIPKVDDHNTITIHPILELFNRGELEQCTLDVVYQMMFRGNTFPEEQKAKTKELINYWIKNKSWKIKIQ